MSCLHDIGGYGNITNLSEPHVIAPKETKVMQTYYMGKIVYCYAK